MTTELFSKDGVTYHTLTIGHSGDGASFLQQEAVRRGIPYEELLRQLEPTEAQKAAAAAREQAARNREEVRLEKIRTAVWDAYAADRITPPGLHDAMLEVVDEPGVAQQRAVFMMLPATLIGKGIAWGFDDTEVRDLIVTWLRDHQTDVRAALAAIKPE
jgi:hypothetical protein